MNLGLRLEHTAVKHADRPALGTPDRTLTYAEFDALSSRVAGGLAEIGIRQGDRVAVMGGSHVDFLASLYGIWKLGGIAVALNAQLGVDEIRYQVENSGALVAVADPGRPREVLDEVASRVPGLRVFDMAAVEGPPVSTGDFPASTDATIFYTSGTTGVPKGATHTHSALLVQLDALEEQYHLGTDDVVLSLLPIYLLSILIAGPLLALHVGGFCRVLSRYEPLSFIETVRKDRPTFIGAIIPLVFADLLALDDETSAKVDLSSLDVVICGGSPMPPETRRAFEEQFNFRITNAYGGTEGPSCVSADPLDRERKPAPSVGIPLAHVKVTIEDDAGNVLPPGAVGEICSSPHEDGPYAGVYEPLRCYWGMPRETEQALRGGKFHWGDLGYLDEDGFLYVVDRLKDMIIRGGMNVFPKELETLLYADERVAECAVVAAPHPRYAEVPFAYIRLAPATTMSEEEALILVNDRLARYKHLVGARFVDDFPRNALGKILKRELRDELQREMADRVQR